MPERISREQRSRNMSRIRSRGNATTELAFLRLLRSAAVSGWRRHARLPGRPDFVFSRQRLAVFLDGCFFHSCPRCGHVPEQNRAYWEPRLERNRCRDRRASRELRARGWRVLRLWEHRFKSAGGRAAALARLQRELGTAHSGRARRLGSPHNRKLVSWQAGIGGEAMAKRQPAARAGQADDSSEAPARKKATFYLDAEDLALLEHERHRRRVEDGQRGADFSGLVREAIRARYGQRRAKG